MSIYSDTLKKCLLESTLNEIKEIDALDYSFIKADEDFRARIKNDTEKSKSFFKSKRFFLILVAALVTLCLIMSISAIRTPVVDFFVEIYDSFSSVFFKVDEPSLLPDKIEIEYQPSYFEENGYEIFKQSRLNTIVQTEWKKDSYSMLLTQGIIGNGTPTINTEHAGYEIAYIGDCKILYTKNHNIISAYWTQDGYYFSLQTIPNMKWSEVEKIVLSIVPVTP